MKIKDIVIIYFSATGNTLYAAEQIKKHLIKEGHNVSLLSVEDTDDIKSMDFGGKLLGVGFPCYAFQYPHKIMDKALDCIKKQDNKVPAFVFATYCIGEGMSVKEMVKKLNEKNFTTIYTGGFKCSSSGFYTLKSGKERGIRKLFYDKVSAFDGDIKRKIARFADSIISLLKQEKPKQVIIKKPDIISFLPRCFAKWNEKRIFTDYSIDNEKCIICRECMDNCPLDNFKIQDNIIVFADNKNCFRCMRCINNCPTKAIALGEKTKGKLRYNKETREKLLDSL